MARKTQTKPETPPRQLHDRETRGEALSPAEQAELSAWYAQQDEAESVLLGANVPASSLETLQAQVDTALARLHTVTQHIETLTRENEAARREVAALTRRLSQTTQKV